MPLTSTRRQERDRPRMASAILTGTILACFHLLATSCGSSLLADDQKPAASSEKTGQEPQSTEAAKTTTSQPAPTPEPKPSPTPKAMTLPAKRMSAPAKPAQTPEPALRFDDLDLEKYHRTVPRQEEEESAEDGDTAAAAGTTVAVKTAKGPQAKARPKPIAGEPDQDPLQAFKDREAKEKFRQMQIETGRDRIAKLQARLDYLNAKRDALSNPAPLLAGQTQTQNPPAKPGEPPPPPTPIQGPGRGITATPGTGKTPIVGLFPPLPPPQTDEDKENDKKLKVKDLIDQVDKEIKSVQEELETARDELASVETRFTQETQSR